MPRLAILTDADACIPEQLRTNLGILTAPLEPEPFREEEPGRDLRRDMAPVEPAGAIQAFARASTEAAEILYLGLGDGYGGGPRIQGAVEAVGQMSPMTRALRLYRSNATLMGCGWQAVAAANAVQAGGGLDEAERAAAVVRDAVEVVAFLEHPQFVEITGAPGLFGARAIVRLAGEHIEVLAQPPRRDLGLKLLRDHLGAAAQAGEGALHVAVHHAGTTPAAEALAQWVARTLAPVSVVLAPLTRHAATRLGPGMLGFAWYRDPA